MNNDSRMALNVLVAGQIVQIHDSWHETIATFSKISVAQLQAFLGQLQTGARTLEMGAMAQKLLRGQHPTILENLYQGVKVHEPKGGPMTDFLKKYHVISP